jgi:RHS repeat-associated protein
LSRRLVLGVTLVLVLVLGAPAGASATSLPTTITADQTWTAAGSPYTGSSVTINSGVSVTVEPGALIKLSGALTVNGTLDVEGTAANPAVFTSSGDSAPGQWSGITLNTGSSTLNHAEIRYGQTAVRTTSGSPQIINSAIHHNWAALVSTSASPQLTDDSIINNSGSFKTIDITAGSPEIARNTISGNGAGASSYTALNYSAGSSQTGEVRIHDNTITNNNAKAINIANGYSQVQGITLAGNTVTNNTGQAIAYVGGDRIPADIDQNTLSGNGDNSLTVGGTLKSSATWQNRGYPIKFPSSFDLKVAAGTMLTLSPGMTFYGPAVTYTAGLTVDGTLLANGTSANPITFTSSKDGGGQSGQPGPTDWYGITLNSGSGASVLDHVNVRYAGTGVSAAGGVQQITNSSLSYDATAIRVTRASPQVTDNTITHSGGFYTVDILAGSPDVARNTLTDNGFGATSYWAIHYTAATSDAGQVRIHDNTIQNNNAGGIDVGNGYSQVQGVTVAGNTISNNTGKALNYVGGERIPPDITENTLTGNGDNSLTVGGTLKSSATWQNGGYPIKFPANWDLKVASGTTLTLSPGMVFYGPAVTYTAGLTVDGTLVAEGTSANPIVFTSSKDAGGGQSGQATAGDWYGITFNVGSQYGSLSNVRVQFAKTGVKLNCPCATPPKIRQSRFTQNWTGAFFGGDPGAPNGGGPVLSNSKFSQNSVYGVDKPVGGTLQVPYNSYGCITGPKPYGCGDAVAAKINPWPEDLSNQPCVGDNPCPKKADPVAVATGAMTYSHTDLSLSNKSDQPLELARSYYSGDETDAGFGPGWSQTGVAVLSERDSGDVLVQQSDGRRDYYTKTGSSYAPPPGIHDVLVKQPDGSFKLTGPDQSAYNFNAKGRLATSADDHGLVTTYGYDANGRLATITDPSSQTLTFTYNASNHVTKVADSTGREVNYTYTSSGDLDTVTDPLGGVTNYDYDSAHRLTAITDPRGVTFLTNTYDAQGRVIQQEDGEGNTWTIRYGANQTTVTEPEGGSRTYAFDSLFRLTSETDELGDTTTRHYDSAGNVDEINRPGGADWAFGYDAAGNLTSVTDPLQGERTFTYDSSNHRTSYTDARGNAWDYTWAGNDLTQITDPESNDTTLTYDAAGEPLTITDANGHTTTYAYDSRGNLLSVADPLDHTTAYGYNSRNFLTSKMLPGHAAEIYTRNSLGDLLSVTTPAGNTTSYTYDANGAQTGRTDPANNSWSIQRDGMERPTVYTDSLGHTTQIAYDGNLNPTSVTDRRGNTTTYSYDDANRLTGIQRPEGDAWQFGYDARGNRTSLTDPRNNTSSYTYDLLDRMTLVDEPLSTTTTYGYDADGNLTSITDPNGNQTTFDYDAVNHRTAFHQPLGKDTTFDFDPAGNLTSRVTGVGTVDYAYDDANRLTGISSGPSTLRSYSYDASNRLTAATDAQGKTIALGYNGDDLLTSIDDGRGQSVTRSYDSRGNLTQQIDGRGTLSYDYDALNRMVSLTAPSNDTFGFSYNHEGELTEADLPNGVVSTNTYDGDGRMTETKSLNGPTVLQDFTYTYDPTSNRTNQTDRNGDQTTYSYDALNRLTEFDPPDTPPVSYAYDDAGNRIQAGSTTYSFNELNQLTSSSDGTTYGYDATGRLSDKENGSEGTTYSWNPLDELNGVDDGSNPITYSYDGLGRRSERTASSSTATMHYGDLTDRPILKSDATGSVVANYVQGPSGLVEERDGSGATYPLTDAHGDVTSVADNSGTIISRESYDPWGGQLSGPALENGFLGAYQRPTDPSTGLMQMGVRPYDPTLGRFLEEDPTILITGMGQTANRHAYAYGNPVGVRDLDGRCGICDFVSDVGGAAAHVITDPGDATTEAVDFWANSDSPVAPVLGPLATSADLALHPGRLDDYLKGCNAAQIIAGTAAVEGSVPLLSLGVAHGAEALAARDLETMFGAGHAAASGSTVGAAADFIGLNAVATAC